MRSPMIGSKGKRVNGLKLLANQMAIYCNPRTQGHSFPSHSMHSFLLHLSSFHSLFLSFFSLFLPTFLPIFLLDLHAVMATGAVSLSLSLSLTYIFEEGTQRQRNRGPAFHVALKGRESMCHRVIHATSVLRRQSVSVEKAGPLCSIRSCTSDNKGTD